VLNPINPGQAITPKHATQINQALKDDTLNFLIPAAQSVGTITVSCNARKVATARGGRWTHVQVRQIINRNAAGK
jgi:hypothetical protein